MSRGCWTGTPVIKSWKWSTCKWKNYPGLVRNSDKINAIFIFYRFHVWNIGRLKICKDFAFQELQFTIGPWRLLWQLFNEIHEQKWSSHRQLKGFPRGFGLVEKPSHGCWSRASTRFSAMAPRESAGWQQRVALAVSWAPEIPRSQIEDINLANLRGLSS